MSTIIEVDDTLNGYNTFHKVREVYRGLRERVFVQEPIQSSQEPLITLTSPNDRRGNYGWELYQQGESLCVLEYFGRWTAYAHESRWCPKPEEAALKLLRITIHNDDGSVRKSIEKTLLDIQQILEMSADQANESPQMIAVH